MASDEGFEPILMQYASGILQPPVQKLVATILLIESLIHVRLPPSIRMAFFYWPRIGIRTHFNATVQWTVARRVGPRRHHNIFESLILPDTAHASFHVPPVQKLVHTIQFATGKLAIESLIHVRLPPIHSDGVFYCLSQMAVVRKEGTPQGWDTILPGKARFPSAAGGGVMAAPASANGRCILFCFA